MASSSYSSVYVTKEEFNLFHSIDRELYALLVLSLLREPAESMQVMALWLWLEQNGFRHVITTLLSLPHFLVNELADEAAAFLSSSAAAVAFPLTQSLLERDRQGLLIALLVSRRPTLALELAAIVDRVCVRAMGEITARAAAAVVPPDGRTMFVTFSKGYPVQEWEVREFFTRAYGDSCIESLHMQEVQPNEQSLFARIVFKMASTIDVILNGLAKAKFTINGKHVWVRRFVPKKPKSQPPQPQPQPQPQQPEHRTQPQAQDEREPLPNLPASLFD